MSDSCNAGASGRLRNRARLIEFLKFRVLASQESFFASFQPLSSESAPPTGQGEAPPVDLQAFRAWLTPLWPAAALLCDQDLRQCIEQARTLYLDPPRSSL